MTTPLATAAWADPDVVSKALRYKPGTFWLGRSTRHEWEALGYKDDRHVCLVSGTRGGKGTTTIINNLVLWPGSVVVVDPKGENATVTANRRGPGSPYCKGLGQKVQVLDPFSAAQVADNLRGTFNPLDSLDPTDPEAIADASLIADALVLVNDKASDPFWDRSARALVKTLILFVLTEPMYEGRRNLITVRQLIMRGETELYEATENIGGDRRSPHELLWEAVGISESFGQILADTGASFASMLANTPKVYESVIQVARDNTEFIDSPNMRSSLATSSFKLSELKTQENGLSLYLCLPQRFMNTHNRWLRTIVTLATNEMERRSGPPRSGHQILFVLDEFAGLQRMGAIESAVAQLAGAGVKLFFVLQSLEQLKKTYSEGWETFLANAGLKIFADIDDNFSREYISKLIGDAELIRETGSRTDSTSGGSSQSTSSSQQTSRSDGRSIGSGTSSHTTGTSTSSGTNQGTSQNEGWSSARGYSETLQRRALVHPDEVGRNYARSENTFMLAGKALVQISGMQPIEIHRSRYFQDEMFMDTFDPHPDHKFPETKVSGVWAHEPLALLRYLSGNDTGPLDIEWGTAPGHSVALGEYIGRVKNAAPAPNTYLRSPYAGRMLSLTGVTPGMPADLLFTVRHYDSRAVNDDAEFSAGLEEQCRAKLNSLREAKAAAKRDALGMMKGCSIYTVICLSAAFWDGAPFWTRTIGAVLGLGAVSFLAGAVLKYFRSTQPIPEYSTLVEKARRNALAAEVDRSLRAGSSRRLQSA